jgi:hypothetical protein
MREMLVSFIEHTSLLHQVLLRYQNLVDTVAILNFLSSLVVVVAVDLGTTLQAKVAVVLVDLELMFLEFQHQDLLQIQMSH